MGYSGSDSEDARSCAFKHLSSALDVIAAFGKEYELRNKELEERELTLKEKEQDLASREQALKAREEQVQRKEQELLQLASSKQVEDQRMAEAHTREQVEHQRMGESHTRERKRDTLSDCKFSSKIILNVGGRLFATSMSTILQFRGSLLESLITRGKSRLENGEYFIDRDPTHFEVVLNYMREGKLRNSLQYNDWEDLRQEFIFYRVDVPLFLEPAPVSLTRKIAKVSHNEDGPAFPLPHSLSILPVPPSTPPPMRPAPCFESGGLLNLRLQDVVKKWLPGCNFVLIHKASINGFKCSDFHSRCDNKGPTLTIIQSKEGYLFGGYTPESWENPVKNTYKSNPFSFIFTLTNPHNIPPTKYLLNPAEKHGIFCSSTTCSAFGGGHDIVVHTNSHQNKYSYTQFPNSYMDSTGYGKVTFTGSLCFTTKDVEIYAVS